MGVLLWELRNFADLNFIVNWLAYRKAEEQGEHEGKDGQRGERSHLVDYKISINYVGSIL